VTGYGYEYILPIISKKELYFVGNNSL
jgi:hypothetical protein